MTDRAGQTWGYREQGSDVKFIVLILESLDSSGRCRCLILDSGPWETYRPAGTIQCFNLDYLDEDWERLA